jgi:phage shock protein A
MEQAQSVISVLLHKIQELKRDLDLQYRQLTTSETACAGLREKVAKMREDISFLKQQNAEHKALGGGKSLPLKETGTSLG